MVLVLNTQILTSNLSNVQSSNISIQVLGEAEPEKWLKPTTLGIIVIGILVKDQAHAFIFMPV